MLAPEMPLANKHTTSKVLYFILLTQGWSGALLL